MLFQPPIVWPDIASRAASDIDEKPDEIVVQIDGVVRSLARTVTHPAERSLFAIEMEGFKSVAEQYRRHGSKVEWDSVHPSRMLATYPDIEKCPPSKIPELASKLVVLKLNGATGDSYGMGFSGPFSLTEVRDDRTFLDLAVQQIETLNKSLKVDIPLLLMDSMHTHHQIFGVLDKYKKLDVSIHTFNQSTYPCLDKATLLPEAESADTPLRSAPLWYPPGHGDVYRALMNSGLLETLLYQGKEYLFLSNIDNLAATIDFDILHHMTKFQHDFLMEVTHRTRADIRGGALVEIAGRPSLVEFAQVPQEKEEEFLSMKKFQYFNTNNLWINLRAMSNLLQNNAFDKLDVITHVKGQEINKQLLLLETAAGSAVKIFANPTGICVPRSRFLPVKSTSDLFLVQSEIFNMEEGRIVINPERPFATVPIVKLGGNFSTLVEYRKRMPHRPRILELDHLTVSGDVYIGAAVVLRGVVIIIANTGELIQIPDGSVLDNKIVQGNFYMVDH